MPVAKIILALPDARNVYPERYVFREDRDIVMIVEGPLQTASDFGSTIRYSRECYDVICYGPHYTPRSRRENERFGLPPLSRHDKAQILRHLTERFESDFLYSASWGGFATLTALSCGTTGVPCAVIASFSQFVKVAMPEFLIRLREAMLTKHRMSASRLVSTMLSVHFPPMRKRLNSRYLLNLLEHKRLQIASHIVQLLVQQPRAFLHRLDRIRCRVKFMNGKLDDYTTVEASLTMARFVPHAQWAAVPNAGNYLHIESAQQAAALHSEFVNFFAPLLSPVRSCMGGKFSAPLPLTPVGTELPLRSSPDGLLERLPRRHGVVR